MEAIAYRDAYTVERVIETIDRTLNEHENAFERLDRAGNKLLHLLGQNLYLVKHHLKFVEKAVEILERLYKITVGGESIPLLNALDRDMSTIRTYLKNAKISLREAEVDGYVQALGRYADVLTVVLSRSNE
jgi:hypothetical protein